MTLLLFWQPVSTGAPTPPPLAEAQAPVLPDVGGAKGLSRRERLRRIDEDDEEVIALVSAFLTKLGR